jgi:hypothetical protein
MKPGVIKRPPQSMISTESTTGGESLARPTNAILPWRLAMSPSSISPSPPP